MNDTRCEIRNRKSRHTISGSKDKDNYIKVNHVTRDDDVVGSFKFHRLIMHHYFPQENENELQVDHINHDRSDNRLLNLQWVTGKDNMHNLSKTNVYEFEYTSDLPKDIIDVTKDLQSQQTMFSLLQRFIFMNKVQTISTFVNGVVQVLLHILVLMDFVKNHNQYR